MPSSPEWKLDGVNLLPYLTGEKAGAPHEALYWRFGPQVAIRTGDWKLVKGVGSVGVQGVERSVKSNMDGAELYHLGRDIGEKTNLAAAGTGQGQRARRRLGPLEQQQRRRQMAARPPGRQEEESRQVTSLFG